MDLDIEDVAPKKGEFYKPDNSKKIAEIEKQISKLLDLYTVDGISLEDIKNRIEKLTDQKNKLIQSQEEEPKREKSIDLVSVKAIMQNGTIDEKRAILTSLIRKITLYADRIDIEWNF
jgi:site-specific DNA recombinase